MPYNAFTLDRVCTDFGITVRTGLNLFGHIPPAPVAQDFRDALREQSGLATAVNTEKARSELLIAPILTEVWRRGRGQIALFSGVSFPADPGAELTGVCDFILGRPPQLDYVTAPVMMNPSWRVPTNASPMMTLASPQTTMPIPICTSAKP